jgi:ketosteroid isomerase-like protein
MKKSLSFLLAILICASVVGFAQKADMPPALRSLVETEREFSKTSAAKGMKDAFLAFLADDGIVFRPGPVNGKKSWGERAAPKGLLTWEPVYADISRAGDMGYTTGPWEFRQNGPSDKPVAYGYFVTVWRKQSDGTWKFVIDLGTDNPTPTAPAPALQFPTGGKGEANSKETVETALALLLKTDSDFSKASATQGTVNAFLSYAADDVRFYRPESFPVTGKLAVRASLSAKPGLMTWQPMKSDVSRSSDLGYTYGSYEFKTKAADAKPTESGYYMRIWKKQPKGEWRVVLDVLHPVPPEQKST